MQRPPSARGLFRRTVQRRSDTLRSEHGRTQRFGCIFQQVKLPVLEHKAHRTFELGIVDALRKCRSEQTGTALKPDFNVTHEGLFQRALEVVDADDAGDLNPRDVHVIETVHRTVASG